MTRWINSIEKDAMEQIGAEDKANRDLPVNRQEAYDRVQSSEDPPTRALLEFALETATTQFLRWDHMSEEEWRSQLPDTPFDMLFFIKVMERMFENKGRMQRMLEGRTDDQFAR